jgi:hypothetical protein
MTLKDFKEKLEEYEKNNVSALGGAIQITQNEREDLLLVYQKLAKGDQPEAAKLLKSRGIDVKP